MAQYASIFFVSLSALFFVVDPFGVVPLFIGMTANDSAEKSRAMALKACIAGAGILVFFALFGALLFKVMNVTLSAFRVAGGILLLITALDMLKAKTSETKTSAEEKREGELKDDIAIVPLAMPLLAGPGSIATVMVLMSKGKSVLPTGAAVVLAIVLTFTVTYLLLRAAKLVQRVLKASGVAILQRVMGLLLAAIAVQFMAEGARELWR